MSALTKFLAAFDSPREWLAWAVFVAASAFVLSGNFTPEHWIAAVIVSAVLQGWIKHVSHGPLTIGDSHVNKN